MKYILLFLFIAFFIAIVSMGLIGYSNFLSMKQRAKFTIAEVSDIKYGVRTGNRIYYKYLVRDSLYFDSEAEVGNVKVSVGDRVVIAYDSLKPWIDYIYLEIKCTNCEIGNQINEDSIYISSMNYLK